MTVNDVVVSRNGSVVIVDIKTPNGDVFSFIFQAGAEWAAKLLRQTIADRLFERARKIRQDAYEQGWRDAKAKKAKQTWFPGGM